MKLSTLFNNLVFPPTCLMCNHHVAAPILVCDRCFDELKPFPAGQQKHSVGDVEIYSRFPYSEKMQEAVHALKFGRATCWIPYFARELFNLHEWCGLGADLLVPVALSRQRLRGRGFNQASLLTSALHKYSGSPCQQILRRAKHTAPQAMLRGAVRRQNVRGVFSLQSKHQDTAVGKRIILVDDVVTTGSTVGECARVLMDAGAAGVTVLSVARS